MMRKVWYVAAFLAIWTVVLYAQATNIRSGGTLPTGCRIGDVYIKTGTSAGLYDCAATNVWTGPLATSAGGGITGPGSSTDNAVVRWDGTGGTAIQNSGVTLDDSNVFAFPDGVKQTFNPNGTNAGFNFGSQAGDPSSLADGDCWNNSSTNTLKCRINGATVSIGGMTCVFATGSDSDSDNTLHDDPTLVFALQTSSTYKVIVDLFFNTGTSNTPDASARFTMPASATFTYRERAFTLAATATTNVFFTGANAESSPTSLLQFGVLTTATSLNSPWEVTGTVVTGGTSGNFQLQWAQNTTTGGTPTVRQAGSSICYQKF